MVETVRGPVADAAAVLAIAAEAERSDGIGALSEQFRLGVTDAGPHLLAAGPDGAVAGYAGVVVPPAGGPGSAEVVVAPSQRRRGLGRALVTGTLELVGDGGTVWAHGDLPAARALAADLGLTAVRTLLNLRRGLHGAGSGASGPNDAGPDTAPSNPPGVTVRTYAGSEDDAAILAVNNAAFAWHPEQGGWTQQQIDERTGAAWFDPAGLFLAVDDQDRLLGFHWTKVADPAAGLGEGEESGGSRGRSPRGEVYIVAVAPEGQGRGLGRLLTAVGLQYLAGRGLSEVELYVEGDNTAALRTYAALGFAEHERHAAYALR
ncbi:mycothiol synthase [Tsukamurella pseudospumae]|uniref:Mycothiol acetyltransferase n=1 Tax=Tsukamurella pseudospumae TaxID=239498 RepID=A0A138A3N8_9ACTN|nr:mycothiol synthase [Tsukamurella pseudospumae]KXO98727.1 mycothiol synthase [Tsukamurella pseudospumae]KXP05048.1 mycothiol synthase [Tsukamurella pseudospumae]